MFTRYLDSKHIFRNVYIFKIKKLFFQIKRIQLVFSYEMIEVIYMFKTKSIQKILQRSTLFILFVILLPLLLNILFYTRSILTYQHMIENINQINNVAIFVKDEFINIKDSSISQTSINNFKLKNDLKNIQAKLNKIKKKTDSKQEIKMLDMTLQAINMKQNSLNKITENTQNRQFVHSNKKSMRQTESIDQLLYNYLQEFVQLEIHLANKKSDTIIHSVALLTVFQLFLMIAILIFTNKNRRQMNKDIKKPIDELVQLTKQLSKGHLSYQTIPSGISELTDLTNNLNSITENIMTLINENAEKQQLLSKSEVKVLQAQITPHFLYNSLDAILALEEQGKHVQMKTTIYALSDYFRISLSHDKDWITVDKEIRHIKDYLTILKIRYGEMLDYSIDVSEDILNDMILKMILQPLVENAVYHGTKFVRRQGLVEIVGRKIEDAIIFTIKDNGIGMTESRLAQVQNELAKGIHTDFKKGYGLYNVNKRMLLYYNRKTQLTITSNYQTGTILTLRLPKI